MLATRDFDAVILDLDGVITSTEKLHAKAWKKTFDEFLKTRHGSEGESFKEFDLEKDYQSYVDGIPRFEGVESFLNSRSINLPRGSIDAEPGFESVAGLGNLKNELFHEVLDADGVQLYSDAVDKIHQWRQLGLKTALVSASRNATKIVKLAGLEPLFDAIVDGGDAAELNLAGKPAPDTFLYVARLLDVEPAKSILIEDAESGVKAGKKGGFGFVVGVARESEPERLRREGADLVVSSLLEL